MSPCMRCHFNAGGDIFMCVREEENRQMQSDRKEKKENACAFFLANLKGIAHKRFKLEVG